MDFAYLAVCSLASVSLGQYQSGGDLYLAYHGSLHVWNGNRSRHYPCNETPVVYRGICSVWKGSPSSCHPRSESCHCILLDFCLAWNDCMSRCPCLPNYLLDYQSLDVFIVFNATISDQSKRMWWAALPTKPCCRNLSLVIL